MTTLLIDGDALVYQIAFSAETKHDFSEPGEEPEVVITADIGEAKFRLGKAVAALERDHWADKVIFALSDPEDNFRYDFYPDYKGNRTGRKPILQGELREAIEARYKTYIRPRLEADDVIGILATSMTALPDPDKIIISDDKDFNTIPVPRFKFRKKDGEYPHFNFDVDSAKLYHLRQSLSGDMTDFYPGCPMQGPAKAEKFIMKHHREWADDPANISWIEYIWPEIVKLYAAKDKDEAFALSQARCARILRSTDFDLKTKTPILWMPDARHY